MKKYNMFSNSLFMNKLAFKFKEKKVIVLGFIYATLLIINDVCELYFLPKVIELIETNESFSSVIFTILIFTSILLFVAFLKSYILENWLYGKITIRTEIFNLLNNKCASVSYPTLFEQDFIKLGTKARQACDANDEPAEAIWQTLFDLLINVVTFIIYFILFLNVKAILLAFILITTLISYFINNKLSNYEYKHRDEEAEYLKQMDYVVKKGESLDCAKDLRIFGLSTWLNDIFKKADKLYIAFHKKAENKYLIGSFINILLTIIRNGFAYYYLIDLVFNKGLSISDFLLYFSTVTNLATKIEGVLNNLNTLHKQSLEISNIREFINYKEAFKFKDGKNIEKCDRYEIKLENVSFKYPDCENYTLKDINLTLHPYEKLAVVGANGAGKTTLIKIICGFMDPTSGRVLLNGKDIRDYNRNDYYKLFSAVFQTFSLLPGTIKLNITQTFDNVNQEKLEYAIRCANLKNKIDSLEKGYDTLLNKEVYDDAISLSGGEMQRLMLARALYKDGSFLILDEPTAALDPIAESEIYNEYNEMAKNKTSIFISHRLASTRFCDHIIYIENNIIEEEGTHEELMKLNKKYKNLFDVQSKYYKEDN